MVIGTIDDEIIDMLRGSFDLIDFAGISQLEHVDHQNNYDFVLYSAVFSEKAVVTLKNLLKPGATALISLPILDNEAKLDELIVQPNILGGYWILVKDIFEMGEREKKKIIVARKPFDV